jgi:hypothetical protein
MLRRPIHPKIVEMGIAIDYDTDPGHRCYRKVSGHYAGRSAEEGKRRFGHAPHAQRNQVGLPPLVVTFDCLQRVLSSGRRFPLGVRFAWHSTAKGFAFGTTLFPRQAYTSQAKQGRFLNLSGVHDPAPKC